MANYTPNLTFSVGQEVTSTDINDLINSMLAIYPVGALMYFHQSPTAAVETVAPLGKFIQCNGAAVSRTTYATLFALIGTTYGSGDGSTTFNLPDLRGRYPVSVGSHTDVSALGKNDGVALANRRMKHGHTINNSSHSHTWSGSLTTGGAHSHTFSGTTGASADGIGSSGNDWPNNGATSSSQTGTESANHTHTMTPSISSASTGASVGVSGNLADTPAYLVGGCWYMAFQ